MPHNDIPLPSYLLDHPKTPPKSVQGALAELPKVSQISDSPVRLSSHTESGLTHQSDIQSQDRVKKLMDAELKDHTVKSTELIGEFTKYARTRKKFGITIQEMSKAINASVNQRENGEIVDVEWEAIVKFIGVIADEDRTVRYSNSEKRETRSQRSGTLPFIAQHILEGTNVPHCAVHDLESKIYLAFWVVAYIVRRKTKSRNLRRDMLIGVIKMLRPDSWDELRDCAIHKKSLLKEWAYQPLDKTKTEYFGAFAPFAEILQELAKLGEKWYEISVKHARSLTMFSNDEIEQVFVEYLNVYDKYMPTEESWDYLQSLEIT